MAIVTFYVPPLKSTRNEAKRPRWTDGKSDEVGTKKGEKAKSRWRLVNENRVVVPPL
jgi:hypothetical protein